MLISAVRSGQKLSCSKHLLAGRPAAWHFVAAGARNSLPQFGNQTRLADQTELAPFRPPPPPPKSRARASANSARRLLQVAARGKGFLFSSFCSLGSRALLSATRKPPTTCCTFSLSQRLVLPPPPSNCLLARLWLVGKTLIKAKKEKKVKSFPHSSSLRLDRFSLARPFAANVAARKTLLSRRWEAKWSSAAAEAEQRQLGAVMLLAERRQTSRHVRSRAAWSFQEPTQNSLARLQVLFYICSKQHANRAPNSTPAQRENSRELAAAAETSQRCTTLAKSKLFSLTLWSAFSIGENSGQKEQPPKPRQWAVGGAKGSVTFVCALVTGQLGARIARFGPSSSQSFRAPKADLWRRENEKEKAFCWKKVRARRKERERASGRAGGRKRAAQKATCLQVEQNSRWLAHFLPSLSQRASQSTK